MKKEVRYHPKVPAEAREFLAYYEAISPRLADLFWKELLEAIEYAREFPERHHFDATGRRRSNLRRFPVHFLFRDCHETIRTTALRHDRRDPKYGSGRR